VLSAPNRIMIQDTGANLQTVIATIKEIEESEAATSFVHQCKYVKAAEAAILLKEFLGEPRTVEVKPAATTPMTPMFPRPPEERRPPPPALKGRPHYVTADDATNTVHINGPADIIGKAKGFLERIDTKDRKYVPAFELVHLTILDADWSSKILVKFFPEPKSGGPLIEADTGRNALVVKGTADQVKEIKNDLGYLGEDPKFSGGGTKVIMTIDKGNAATLAEELERLLKKLRNNPVEVIGGP